jgi:hypothetical protein
MAAISAPLCKCSYWEQTQVGLKQFAISFISRVRPVSPACTPLNRSFQYKPCGEPIWRNGLQKPLLNTTPPTAIFAAMFIPGPLTKLFGFIGELGTTYKRRIYFFAYRECIAYVIAMTVSYGHKVDALSFVCF